MIDEWADIEYPDDEDAFDWYELYRGMEVF
jgi:hypothetical protein